MTAEQRSTVNDLVSDGFTLHVENSTIKVVKGNDYRLVLPDGSQRRAKGARK